jgi:hypothetical protein
MIWHIIKKDWKLSWLMITGVAAIHWAVAMISFNLGLFSADRTLAELRVTLDPIALMGSALLIAVIVHQDAIPGVRQDWLARPIQRWHLLLEKVLFVVAAVQGPILAADIFQGLANGFSFRQTLAAALSRAVFLLLSFTLPVLAFTSLTRNMTEAIVSAVIASVAWGLVVQAAATLSGGYDNFRLVQPTSESNVGWIGDSFKFVLFLLGASAILGLQYFRRKTMLSRCLTAVFLLLLFFISFLPWKPAFAIQQRLSPSPGSGAATVLAFNPGAGRFHYASGISPSDENMRRYRHEGKMAVHVPLQVAGLPTDSVLLADRSEVCLIGASGKTEYCGTGQELRVSKEGPDPGEAQIYQEIDVPFAVYRHVKDQPTGLGINYSLTQWRLDRSYAIPAVGGDERTPGLGWCKTKVNEAETAVEIRCMQPGKGPTCRSGCASGFLENATSGRRNPEKFDCHPDYSPYFVGADSIMTRFNANFEFRDATGLAHFPVDGPQLLQSRVVVRLYQPTDHFTRQVVIPRIKLQEWEAQ